MKRLYEVERHFYVMAEDESEAERYQPRDPLSCTNHVFEAQSVESEWFDTLPFNSDDDALPSDDNKTCGEILKSVAPLP